jgi:DNA-binding NarL/FixJ family response regulator
MHDGIAALSENLGAKIRLLIVDDQEIVCQSIRRLFSSPLFSIQTAESLERAKELIRRSSEPWHCWIVDVALEHKNAGLLLLSEHREFPFAVMLSGLGSMSMASQAMQAGAIAVFDKDPHSMQSLYELVCSVSALGFLLKGKTTKYLATFQLLDQHPIDTPDAWAQHACISVRQLERICALHSPLTPRLFRPLFYALRYVLLLGSHPHPQEWHFRISRAFHEKNLSLASRNLHIYREAGIF